MKKVQFDIVPQIDADTLQAFDRLRVNLGFCGDEMKAVMVTSSASKEGKSFVCIQLWKRLAEIGVPTLLIDCDLQNSKIFSKCNSGDVQELDGITQYLSEKAELEDVLYETDVPNGYILPVTSLNERAEVLLTNKRFSQMVEICKKRFGCVLIDTPSIDSLPDVMNVATHCDGMLLVVRSASTPRQKICECVQALQRTGTPLLGIVLNCFDVNNKPNSYSC